MRVVRFEPGDATSYVVIYHVLNAAEEHEVGGFSTGDEPVLFGFAPRSGPWDTYAFSSENHGELDYGYYAEKMTRGGHEWGVWTTVAGAMVLSYLTGRELRGAPDDMVSMIEREWDNDWGDLLCEKFAKDAV